MKSDRLVQRVSANLDLLRFPSAIENPIGPNCLHCSSELTLHQPDMDSPERLLGVCERCKHWYLIDLLHDVAEGVMVWLPDNEVVRSLSHEDPAAGISLMGHDADPGSTLPQKTIDEPGRSPSPNPHGPT